MNSFTQRPETQFEWHTDPETGQSWLEPVSVVLEEEPVETPELRAERIKLIDDMIDLASEIRTVLDTRFY